MARRVVCCVLLLTLLVVSAVVDATTAIRRQNRVKQIQKKMRKAGWKKPNVSYVNGPKKVADSDAFLEAALENHRRSRATPVLPDGTSDDVKAVVHATCYTMSTNPNRYYYDLEKASGYPLGRCVPSNGDWNGAQQCTVQSADYNWQLMGDSSSFGCSKGSDSGDPAHPMCQGMCVCVPTSAGSKCRCAQEVVDDTAQWKQPQLSEYNNCKAKVQAWTLDSY